MALVRVAQHSLPTVSDLADLLGQLGSTPGEVARCLAATGVRGVPADVQQCPIAVYLNAVVGAERQIRSLNVWSDRIRVGFGRFITRPREVPLSPCLREFIERFDGMCYPELIRSPARHGARY